MTTTRLWRLAGALVLAHVVLLFAGVALEQSPVLGDSRPRVVAALVRSSMTTVLTGGFLQYLACLVFLVGAVLLVRLLRGSTETSGWLASSAGAAAVTYAAVTIATGFAAGAAALYNGHSGAPLATVIAVNDVRNFGFFLSLGVLGVFTLAVAGAIHAGDLLPRWVAYSGYVIGTLCIAAIPAQPWDAVNVVNLVWLVWFVALGIVALRGPRPAPADVRAVPVGA
jgi:hypothetical protein